MNHSTIDDTNLSILELPLVLTNLFERAQRPLLPESQGSPGLFVRYLRRKPGRGLAVIYMMDALQSSGKKTATNDPNRAVSLTLDEIALEGAQIRFNAQQIEAAPLEIQPSGVLRVDEVGLSVQAFPADSQLPALAASCDTQQGTQLFQTLESVAQAQLGDGWHLVSAAADPVRYKPANRCVIRYRLNLKNEANTEQKHLTLFGKVYGNPQQARSIQALMQKLYDEQVKAEQASILLPRPFGTIDELGLTINEAIQPPLNTAPDTLDVWQHLRTGTQALQPTLERGRGGEVTQVVIPTEELELTARALAQLHNSAIHPDESTPRTGAKEAKRARERASLIAGRNPEQAEEVQHLASDLATRLALLQPDTYRPAHGGFKASQLLFHSHSVFVVDFDGFCLADPSLDVGYFLAYLRPTGLWYQRAGMREWFEKSAQVFTTTYQQAMLNYGVSAAAVDSILERSRLYEAALLFKIATRRVNRLNSPRPKELSAMLNEIANCLTLEARRK